MKATGKIIKTMANVTGDAVITTVVAKGKDCLIKQNIISGAGNRNCAQVRYDHGFMIRE